MVRESKVYLSASWQKRQFAKMVCIRIFDEGTMYRDVAGWKGKQNTLGHSRAKGWKSYYHCPVKESWRHKVEPVPWNTVMERHSHGHSGDGEEKRVGSQGSWDGEHGDIEKYPKHFLPPSHPAVTPNLPFPISQTQSPGSRDGALGWPYTERDREGRARGGEEGDRTTNKQGSCAVIKHSLHHSSGLITSIVLTTLGIAPKIA